LKAEQILRSTIVNFHLYHVANFVQTLEFIPIL